MIQKDFGTIPNTKFVLVLLSNLFLIFQESISGVNSDNHQKKRNILESFEITYRSFTAVEDSNLELDNNTIELIAYQANRIDRFNNLANLIVELFEYLDIKLITFMHQGGVEDVFYQSFFKPSKFVQYLSEGNKRTFSYNFSMSEDIIQFKEG